MDEQMPPKQPMFTPEHPDNEPSRPVGDYTKGDEPYQQFRKKTLVRNIVIIAIFLVALGGGAFAYINNKNTKQAKLAEPVSEVAKQPNIKITTDTKRYSSSQFALDFDQPIDWEIKDELASGILTATSPNISIPTTKGSTATGKIILTIKGKNQKLTEFDAGNAGAVIDSEKVAYIKPSSAQRGQTYISFLSYPGSSDSVLIDGVYITGDSGYTKTQPIPKVDIQKIDPIITMTFFACDGTCTKAIGITPEAWADPEFGGVLKKILQSFTIN